MKIDKERMQEVFRYLNQHGGQYSFRRFAEENDLLEGAIYRGDNVVVSCPFHEDASPSCSLNDELHAYHCFSCGRHGSFPAFVAEYRNHVLGIRTGVVQVLNDFLREDAQMQSSLGFSSIIRQEDSHLPDGYAHRHIIYPKRDTGPDSFLEMVTRMKKRGLSLEEKMAVILLIQRGFSVEEIWKDFAKESTEQKEDKVLQGNVALKSLLEGVD